jgi:hypothetical protein
MLTAATTSRPARAAGGASGASTKASNATSDQTTPAIDTALGRTPTRPSQRASATAHRAFLLASSRRGVVPGWGGIVMAIAGELYPPSPPA